MPRANHAASVSVSSLALARTRTGPVLLVVHLVGLLAALSFALLAWLALAASAASATEPEAQIELILDASGSMWNPVDDGRFRITAAKAVLADFVDGLPDEGLDVGLRIYGSQVAAKRDGACADTRLFVPIEGVEKSTLKARIEAAEALGATPIALSLQQAADDFAARPGAKVVVLVTDGEEACRGDVRAAAEGLAAAGIELRIVGFDLDAEAEKSFEGLGTFENAADAKALAGALGRAMEAVMPPLGEARLEAPDEVPGGQAFELRWQGENGYGDYVTIVAADAAEGTYGSWRSTADGSPMTLTAPMEPGSYELRYQSDRVGGIAARRPIRVVKSAVALQAPPRAMAGSTVPVTWLGPNGEGDYVTVVPAQAEDGAYGDYFYTSEGQANELNLPFDAGRYEVRYQTERGVDAGRVYARTEIEVFPAEVRIVAPSTARAGSAVEVRWGGPNGYGDYVTVVPADAPAGTYGAYFYTQQGNPQPLRMPEEPGPYELRYQSERDSERVLARASITVR